jgi:acyl-CoA thioesterase YciA
MASLASEPHLAVKVIMMPRDTNPHGAIFGGVLLSYMDQAGSIGADFVIRQSGWPIRPLVTVAMKTVEFHQPVFVGDVVSFWTTLDRIGVTSITMQVWAEAERSGQVVKLTGAQVTYVAVTGDGTRRPTPIRPQA